MKRIAHPVDIIVVGASGDLARRKIFPALFALYCQGFLPDNFRIFGFARSRFSDAEFRDRIMERLTCRYAPGESCADRMREFLARCRYVSGQYGSSDSYLDLYQAMQDKGPGLQADRLFYLAIPPSVFVDVARAIGDAGLVSCTTDSPRTHVVIEKPFGHDRASSDSMTGQLASVFSEEQTFRIDHYLGKEVVQNLIVLRFANRIFEPLWNRDHIEHVCIDWKEDIGVGDRGGYFDRYGIVRDVIQNHLLQILALVAMEQPVSLSPRHVRDAKVAVLQTVPPVELEDMVLGQYRAATVSGRQHPGYTAEPSVPDDSVTPTYAAAVLRVENERWRGVPFAVQAGKALNGRCSEVRIRFRLPAHELFADGARRPEPNELVIRIQPDEAIYLSIVNKEPGLGLSLAASKLDLEYSSAFGGEIPDAYECLLLDAIQGDKSLFIRSDELQAAWDIFTPVLHRIEESCLRPEPYDFGSPGPDRVRDLLTRAGIREAAQ